MSRMWLNVECPVFWGQSKRKKRLWIWFFWDRAKEASLSQFFLAAWKILLASTHGEIYKVDEDQNDSVQRCRLVWLHTITLTLDHVTKQPYFVKFGACQLSLHTFFFFSFTLVDLYVVSKKPSICIAHWLLQQNFLSICQRLPKALFDKEGSHDSHFLLEVDLTILCYVAFKIFYYKQATCRVIKSSYFYTRSYVFSDDFKIQKSVVQNLHTKLYDTNDFY